MRHCTEYTLLFIYPKPSSGFPAVSQFHNFGDPHVGYIYVDSSFHIIILSQGFFSWWRCWYVKGGLVLNQGIRVVSSSSWTYLDLVFVTSPTLLLPSLYDMIAISVIISIKHQKIDYTEWFPNVANSWHMNFHLSRNNRLKMKKGKNYNDSDISGYTCYSAESFIHIHNTWIRCRFLYLAHTTWYCY